MNNKFYVPKILVCPLDWGLGHATRCIPVVKELIAQGAEVIIAGEGAGMNLLSIEFPHVEQMHLKGYNIRFSERISLGNYLILRIPGLILRIIQEHFQLRQLIKETNTIAVISDNRYGLWNKKIYSVFITHQPNIFPPKGFGFLKPLLRLIARFFIKKYDECWIPDTLKAPGLSGELSHGHILPLNVKFIGPLSRFKNDSTAMQQKLFDNQTKTYEIVAIISGPEPHRSQFENLLTEQLSHSSLKSLMVRGKADKRYAPIRAGNLTIHDHLNASNLFAVLKNSKVVICRGGYSTLMDLAYTGNKVVCVPTPGQTEQEYIARLAESQGYAVLCSQKDFRLPECYEKAMQTDSLPVESEIVSEAVKSLLERVYSMGKV